MNLNKNINDCQGSCKTPAGCSCGKQNSTSSEKGIEIKGGLLTVERKKCGCSCKRNHKLEVYDWLSDLPEAQESTQMIEVQFKNTRKGYYLNSNNLELYKGDIVAVEATPGHDIGEVTLTGKLVLLQIKKNNYRPLQGEHKRVYRIAKPSDIEKYEEAKSKEHATMLRAREIAEELNLGMKISDVEYQGDGNKAIFYYIADERVDFRQLIKVYAEKFRVKIEMKQIGARQEAGRVGGIGPCGRELCCSGSMSNFVSVSTAAARFQDISLNPLKLAGQCGKLKCCLNYEVDTYVEAQRELPSRDTVLDTKDSVYYHFKTDILARALTYSTSKDFAANLITIDKDRAFEIIKMNRRGHKPISLVSDDERPDEKPVSLDILEQGNINRFDDTKRKKGNNNNGSGNGKKIFKNNNGNTAGTENNNRNEGEREKRNNPERPSNNQNRRNRPNRGENKQPEGVSKEKKGTENNSKPEGDRENNNRNRNGRNRNRPRNDNRPQNDNNNGQDKNEG